MKSPRIFVPNDATAVACGADRVARKLEAGLLARGITADITRNGSRGLFWLCLLYTSDAADE